MRTPNVDAVHVAGAPGYDHAAINAQMAKVLESAHFRNSKRSRTLLRFVVDATLSGDHGSLKERSIGVAVFGRDPAYDTAQDPIVRNAAIEVRKRLAQYYLESEHVSELRIDLPLGSYMPAFAAETSPAEVPAVEAPKPAVDFAAARPKALTHVIVMAAVVILGVATTVLWSMRRTPVSELDAFWEPLFRDRKPIQICIGQPSRLYRFTGPRSEELNRLLGGPPSPDRKTANLSIAPGDLAWVAPEYLFQRDALSAFNVASWIQAKGRAYQLISVSQTNYSQLRHQPMVAIGAFNNPWSLRVTAELRFVFDHRNIDGVTYSYIADRRNPNAADWKVAQPAGASMTADYAIVTRVFDPATEKTVISAAGIETYGTLAATEFVIGPEYLGAALHIAAREWRHKNAQFVLETRIIDGTPGPPRVLATHFW